MSTPTDSNNRLIDFIDLTDEIAEAANVDQKVAAKVMALFEEGHTVPFLARYRKEAIGGLQPSTLHRLKDKLDHCRSLMDKLDKSFQTLGKQGLLTPELTKQLQGCKSLDEVKLLTDPLKRAGPKSLASRAKACNLEPLALELLTSSRFVDISARAPKEAYATFKTVSAIEEAISHIIADRISKDLDVMRHAEQLCTFHPPTIHTTLKRGRTKGSSVEEPMEIDSGDSFHQSANLNTTGMKKKKKNNSALANHRSMKGEENGSGGVGTMSKSTKDDLVVFKNYLKFSRPIPQLHAHQTLAINRACERDVISAHITFPAQVENQLFQFVMDKYSRTIAPEHRSLLSATFRDAWKRLIEPHLCRIVRSKMTEKAQNISLDVFSENLRRRLMTAPLRAAVTTGSQRLFESDGVISSTGGAPGDRLPVLGLDPGFRHGCKWAACDPHGEVLSTGIVWLPEFDGVMLTHRPPPSARSDSALAKLTETMKRHNIQTIALGNGQASRQTGRWLSHLITIGHFSPLSVRFAVVSEAGASWYSASEFADKELPQLDVSVRGAVSIARRLQDPLAELVKVEPKHLGVGMYQHDLPDKRLVSAVNALMEECISFVGVDLNTVPVHILARVAGLSMQKAKSIVAHRSRVGGFRTRSDLLNVKGIGPSTLGQCAGFVRVRPTHCKIASDSSKDVEMITISSDDDVAAVEVHQPGTKRKRQTAKSVKTKKSRQTADPFSFNPLDQTAVHPDTYEIATDILRSLGFDLLDVGSTRLRGAASDLFWAADRDERLKPFSTSSYGLDTLRDIVEALSRPLDFDERQDQFLPLFHSCATSLSDLQVGMEVSGRIENVTTFGAFCDIGVQQDAYIPRHLYPKLPATANGGGLFSLRLGDRITAEVSSLDVKQNRVSLEKIQVLPSVVNV